MWWSKDDVEVIIDLQGRQMLPARINSLMPDIVKVQNYDIVDKARVQSPAHFPTRESTRERGTQRKYDDDEDHQQQGWANKYDKPCRFFLNTGCYRGTVPIQA